MFFVLVCDVGKTLDRVCGRAELLDADAATEASGRVQELYGQITSKVTTHGGSVVRLGGDDGQVVALFGTLVAAASCGLDLSAVTVRPGGGGGPSPFASPLKGGGSKKSPHPTTPGRRIALRCQNVGIATGDVSLGPTVDVHGAAVAEAQALCNGSEDGCILSKQCWTAGRAWIRGLPSAEVDGFVLQSIDVDSAPAAPSAADQEETRHQIQRMATAGNSGSGHAPPPPAPWFLKSAQLRARSVLVACIHTDNPHSLYDECASGGPWNVWREVDGTAHQQRDQAAEAGPVKSVVYLVAVTADDASGPRARAQLQLLASQRRRRFGGTGTDGPQPTDVDDPETDVAVRHLLKLGHNARWSVAGLAVGVCLVGCIGDAGHGPSEAPASVVVVGDAVKRASFLASLSASLALDQALLRAIADDRDHAAAAVERGYAKLDRVSFPRKPASSSFMSSLPAPSGAGPDQSGGSGGGGGFSFSTSLLIVSVLAVGVASVFLRPQTKKR